MQPLDVKRSKMAGKQANPRAYTCPSKACYHLFQRIFTETLLCAKYIVHFPFWPFKKCFILAKIVWRNKKAISMPKEISLPETFFYLAGSYFYFQTIWFVSLAEDCELLQNWNVEIRGWGA